MSSIFKNYSRTITYIIFAYMVSVGGYYYFARSAQNTLNTEVLPSAVLTNQKDMQESIPTSEITPSDSDSLLKNMQENVNHVRSLLWGAMNEVYAWQEAHGYFYKTEKTTEYNSYDENTLKTLADGGDLRAIMMLGDRYLMAGKNKESIEYFRQATYRGSTFAFKMLGILLEPNQFDINESEIARKKSYYEVLALYRVAELRGDANMAKSSTEMVVERSHLELTTEDYDAIEKRAHEIYEEILQNRKALGLGEFDDSMSENVKIYNGLSDGMH